MTNLNVHTLMCEVQIGNLSKYIFHPIWFSVFSIGQKQILIAGSPHQYHFQYGIQTRAKQRTNCFAFQLQWLLLLPSLELHWDGKLKLMKPKRLGRDGQTALTGMSLEARYMYLFGLGYPQTENFQKKNSYQNLL